MKRILFSLLILAGVLFLTTCDSLSFLQSTPSPAEREAEEYAVYRAILGVGEERCIHSQTIPVGTEPGPHVLYPESFPEIDPKLIEDFNQASQESILINPDLLGEPVTLLSGYDEWPCMFIQGFSRVGFNTRMDEALIYHESKAPPWALAGGGEMIYLVKGEDGTWKVEWSNDMWKS